LDESGSGKFIAFLKRAISKGRFILMPEHPLKTLESLDPYLLKLVEDTRQSALGEGALPKKFKLLIALVLDASHGAVDGVASLARAAMQAGATKEEIAEALRVAQYITGVGSIYTASRALREVFPPKG
jgi:alkylhydroperoxidase/carboxymuconolactone decarboxylase family protein YurZ